MLSASANNLSKLKEQAEEYAALIMEELDPNKLGYIELWQLEILQLPGQLMAGKDNYRNFSQILSQTLSQTLSQSLMAQRSPVCTAFKSGKIYLLEHWQKVWMLALWIAVIIALFIWKFIQYGHEDAFEILGYCLQKEQQKL